MKQCQTGPCITLFPGEAGCFRPVAALHGDPIREGSMFRYASSHRNIHDTVQTHTYLCSLSASGALDYNPLTQTIHVCTVCKYCSIEG